MTPAEEIKKTILESAQNRFRQYGFNKTTMAEIARDCDMSAANIYRFFESKKNIIAELVILMFKETEDGLRDVVRRPGLSATDKLEAFILEMLHYTNKCCGTEPKINEAVDFITHERYDLVEQHKDVKISLIAEILRRHCRHRRINPKSNHLVSLPALLAYYQPGRHGTICPWCCSPIDPWPGEEG